MESSERHEFPSGAGRYKMKLEDQISEMKRTIEDLKQKVVEQREELWKEKQENDKMIREQEVFRKQLVSGLELEQYLEPGHESVDKPVVKESDSSMFHLPHCPVLNSPECPVHPSKTHHYADHPGESGRSVHSNILDDKGPHFNESTIHNNLLRAIRLGASDSCEDLFDLAGSFPLQYSVSPAPPPPPTALPPSDDVTHFALLLSDSCQSRLREAQLRDLMPKQLTTASAPYQDREESADQLVNAQSLSPNQFLPNM